MHLNISHKTEYAFDRPVEYALQQVRLRPVDGPLQTIGNWDVTVEGGGIEASYVDHFGNHVDLVSAASDTQSLTLTAVGQASTTDAAGILGKTYGRAPLWLFLQDTILTTAGPNIEKLASLITSAKSVLDGLHQLSAAILNQVPYEVGKTKSHTQAEQVFQIGSGVCQDHAHIFVAAARIAGLPARYVSGYLFMPDSVDQDAGHAWAEVHLDDLGWVGFDVSNGVAPDEKYLRIAVGRDAADAAPVSGLRVGASDEAMIVSLQIQQ
ncbi:MAG: transglutaminase family protein [Pseudomonadota bacterium]